MNNGGPPIIVTKRGKPVVRIVRVEPKKKRKSLKGSIVYQGDITSPTDVTWDALGAARGK
jgi:antitoxin (DNA-binding transcriptional repressor) of toxin-antitoxin stability system